MQMCCRWKGRWRGLTLDVAVQHLLGMAVSQTLEELLHVAFDLRDGEALPRVGESSEIVVTKLHDHVNRAFALVVVGGCGEAHAATATARCGVSDRKKKGTRARRRHRPAEGSLSGLERCAARSGRNAESVRGAHLSTLRSP